MGAIQLIVNGDNFGISPSVNSAILLGHREGIFTSCSLMVAEEAAESAVQMARELPTLSVGLHLVTVLGRSVLPHRDIPHLVDLHGRFPSDPTRAWLLYHFSCKARPELRRELTAQFEVR